MNILILADLVTFSGVGNYIRFLSTSFLAKGDNVIIATAQDDLHIEGVKTYLLKPININPFNIFCNLIRIRGIIRKYSIDVVHANHRMSSFLMGVYNLFYSHIPIVWTSHSGAFPMNSVKKVMGYYGDQCIAVSSESKEFILNSLNVPERRVNLIYNGVDEKELTILSEDDVDNIKRLWRIPSEKIVIAIHGRIAHAKGIDFLIDTLSKLDEEKQKRIVVVCSGEYRNNEYYEELKNRLFVYRLQDLFIFMGWCKSRDLLGIADIMLQPSRREGFPLAAVEAFFMEVPVIRTQTGGYSDMKDICIGVSFGDKKEFLSKIEDFIDNPLIFSNMVKKAKAKALEQFTLDTMVNKTYAVYLSAIESVKNK